MWDRTVFVTGIHEEINEEDLQIYFQSKKKSNGGDIESIEYRRDTGEAKITFADDEVARIVATRKHNLKGCKLTVEMSSHRKTDMSDDSDWTLSVLVRGISEKTTKDALQNYFENTRRSSGGDVKDITLDGNQATVTFESPETATRVLEWGKHNLDCQSLTVTRIKPNTPKKITTKSSQEPETEERSRVVCVKRISRKTTKDALLNFFENKRRSGGGEIEDIQYNQDEGIADITFCYAEDAGRVAEKMTLQLDSVQLILTLKEIPKVLPKDPRKVHVMGLSDKTTKDGLMSLMEVASGEEVESMIFGEESNAMITFEQPPDFEKIVHKCKSRPLDGSYLKVEQVSICDCIEVSGLGSKTTSDTILYYFENAKKSGGGDVKKVEYTDGEFRALVFFENSQDVEKVVIRKHVINEETLKVVPYYPFLGETSQEPGGGKKEKKIPVDPHTIPFIKEFFNQEFQELLKKNEVRHTYEEGQEELILLSTNNKIDKARWDGSCKAIEEYINQIITQQVQISSVAWDDLLQHAENTFQSVKDKMEITRKDKDKQIVLRGRKQNVDALTEMLDDLSKEIEKKIEYEKAKVTDTISMSKAQFDLIIFTGIAQNLTLQFKELNVDIVKERSLIQFKGPDQVVKQGNTLIWETLIRMKEIEMKLSKSIANILTSDEGMKFLAQEFKKSQIDAVICPADGIDDTKIMITAVDRKDLKKAMDLIKEVMTEGSVSLDENQQPLLLSEKWNQLEDDFRRSMLLKVTQDPRSNTVSIAGVKEQVDEAKESVLTFFEENAIIEKTLEADAGHIKYILRFEKAKLQTIEDKYNHQSVQIMVGRDGDELTIHGTKEGTQKAFSEVQKLISQIKEKIVELNKPGVKKLFSDEKGMKLLSNIENDHSCVIERCSTGDEKVTSVASVSSQGQKICSFMTPEGKTITLIKGDLTEFKVDVVVNAANSRLKHAGGLAYSIVKKGGEEIQTECDDIILRQGDLLDGEAIVTGPGKLSCKRLVHAVGPKWPSYTSRRAGETKEEGILAQTVLNALGKAKDFTSIAIPAISAGVFGFPADVCAKTIVESILQYSEENDKSKLSEVYIVELKDDVLKAFSMEMRSRFGRMPSFTDSSSPAKPKPKRAPVGNIVGNRRSTSKGQRIFDKANPASMSKNLVDVRGIKIEVIIGDLAKDEAHVIVNTVSSDLDLSRNPCAIALSSAAGPGLQQECKAKGNLKAGEVLVTEGYSLGCKNVFHVVAGEWKNGQGEKVLRSLIISCLTKADGLGFSSIAFPAIGTGNLAFPRNVVARIFFEEVESFKKKYPQTSILEVHLVLFHKDQPTIDAFQSELKNRGNPNKAAEDVTALSHPKKGKRRSHGNGGHKNAQIGSVDVELIPGDITNETTEAIVTVSNTSLDLSLGGGVGAAIARIGGPSIQRECKNHGDQRPGTVICTSAGDLPSRKVFHLVPESMKPNDMTAIVSKCFFTAESQGIKSISVPAVGTGNINIPPKEAAKALLKAVQSFCKSNPSSLGHIRIVVFQEHMINDFHNAIEDLIKSESGTSGWSEFWSWLKGIFSGNGEKRIANAQDHSNFHGIFEDDVLSSKTHQKMWLKILASDHTNITKADKAIIELIREKSSKKEIDNRQFEIEGLSKTQKERILQLQEKHATEIQIESRSARIIICGISEDVVETAFEIYNILNEQAKEENQRKYAKLVAKSVQWFYIDGDNKEPYDDETNAKIEEAYNSAKDFVIVTIFNEDEKEERYMINFKLKTETNLDSGVKMDIKREELVGKGIPLPNHWDDQPKDTNGKEKDLLLVTLDTTKAEYNKVVQAINKTAPTINIVKIERVQNPELYRSYIVKKQKMDDKDGSNEMSLFHGTPTVTCTLINHKGFNRSFCGKNAVVYGQGVYFARDASYSMRPQYSPPDAKGNRCMYLASVLVGKYTVGNEKTVVPPQRDPNNPTITYDTTVNDTNNPEIFVAYHDCQVYPEYLVTFF